MRAQRTRQVVELLWERCVVRVTVLQVLITGALVYGFDAFFDALDTSAWWSGPVDWVAHIGTALLVLNLLPWGWRRAILLPALLGSFLIDLDHIPKFLGSYFLTAGRRGPTPTRSPRRSCSPCSGCSSACAGRRRAPP